MSGLLMRALKKFAIQRVRNAIRVENRPLLIVVTERGLPVNARAGEVSSSAAWSTPYSSSSALMAVW